MTETHRDRIIWEKRQDDDEGFITIELIEIEPLLGIIRNSWIEFRQASSSYGSGMSIRSGYLPKQDVQALRDALTQWLETQ